jgi:hypothetical protein
MSGYAILFTGTRFIDGVYMEHSLAYACAESLRGQFPHLQVDLIQVGEGFRISDDIFWVDHLEELEELNRAGDRRAKRTLTDVSVQGHNHSIH